MSYLLTYAKDWSNKTTIMLVTVRLLLKILQHQQSSFVLKRNRDARKTTDEALQRLRPKETTLQALTEVSKHLLLCCCLALISVSYLSTFAASHPFWQLMSEDLIPEKMREDHKDGESLTSVRVQDFNVRWWDKILQSGVLNTDGWSAQWDLDKANIVKSVS